MEPRKSLLILFLSLATICGCGKRIPEGVYYERRSAKEITYIELKSDGTFFLKQRGQQVVGKVQAEEGGITLIFEGGQAQRWQLKGDTLIGGGEEYIRWQRGKSGFEFEQKVAEIQSKNREILMSPNLSDEDRELQRLDLYAKEGFISREEADRQRESINKRYHPSHKDAIINDLNNIAGNAYQYRIRPSSMGGSPDRTYNGFKIPPSLVSNQNAAYQASVQANSILLTATSSQGQGTITATLDQNGRLSNWTYSGNFK